MEHQKFKELIQLALLNELSEEEMNQLHSHMIECNDCQSEFDELNKYYTLIEKQKPAEVDEKFLQDVRRQFRIGLEYEISKKSFLAKSVEAISKFFWINKTPAITGAFTLIIGLGLGYALFSSNSTDANSLIQKGMLPDNNTLITNIRFSNTGINDGQVEFTFDAVKPVTMKGRINDPTIQNILAKALINEKNPGARIEAVNALSTNTNNKNGVDSQVKVALVKSAESDANPGVRREALKALLNLPYDKEIKSCLLNVLVHDDNSALRIMAINGLAAASFRGQPIDAETQKILTQKANKDDNEYIRIRAASLLKEEQLQ